MADQNHTPKDPSYEPEAVELVRDVDKDLEVRLVGKPAVEVLADALRKAAFDFDEDDVVTIATADELQIVDAEEYARGYELLAELGALEVRITAHYGRFDKPLNFLLRVVRSVKNPQTNQVTPIKQALARRLGAWKAKRDEADRQERRQLQEAADAAARAGQVAKAESLERVAAVEPNPQLAASFRSEAAQIRAVDVHAAPVETSSSVPLVEGGYTRTTWKCEFVDVKELLKAYVEGRCFLDETAIIEGLQSSMDKQAANLGPNLSKAFPGTQAIKTPMAVSRRRS